MVWLWAITAATIIALRFENLHYSLLCNVLGGFIIGGVCAYADNYRKKYESLVHALKQTGVEVMNEKSGTPDKE